MRATGRGAMNGDDLFSKPPAPPKRASFPLRRSWIILGATVILVVGVVAFSINRIMITVLHSRPEVVVPRLEGKSLLEALNIVSHMDLSIQQEATEFDESLPAGTIIRQQPPPGMNVR